MEYSISKETWADPKKRARALKRIHADANRAPRSPLIIEVGKMLKERRELKKLTQEQLQHESGVVFKTIIEIENGRSNPTVETLEKLAAGLGLELRIEFVRPKQPNHNCEDNS